MQPWKLSPELQERSLALTDHNAARQGEFVLYWAHHALRTHDNPALDAAASIALQAGLPLLVYQGLGGRHRYNSDRHHRFILEAARDFSEQLSELGQRLVFSLPEDPIEPGPLSDLLARSAAVVSELYPVPPFRSWYRAHAENYGSMPWLLVDASCILPMPLSDQAPTRAFQFRNKHGEDIRGRVAAGWPRREEWPKAFSGDPGFEPFDLEGDLLEAIAVCHIDHSIPAVSDTPGGSDAGYKRWVRFLEHGLDDYHRLRNDAALPRAVSRMSAYLHYGCVSPFRIAREASERGGEGASKFLDELLTWRELSHHFCFRSAELESLEALPGWARDSLLEHEIDPREKTFDWESLARGNTGTELWDLAQCSLLRRGELHNNLRMTWGKALLTWAQSPSRALKLMIDLNHRYALDGNDPNSYGGLLWCMGQFDRAFPPGPIFGKVRQRSVARHAARLDTDRYAAFVRTPAGGGRLRVAVVGAGLSGLTAARTLHDQGHVVTVVDKGRKPGGRMSTRHAGELRFDHGAQYFTARDPRFLRHVFAWRERGLVEPWDARIAILNASGADWDGDKTARYVAVPGMNSICQRLANDLPDVRCSWRLSAARREGDAWRLVSSDGEAIEADILLLALPPEQIVELLPGTDIAPVLADVEMRPCWAVMAELDRPLSGEYDGAFVNHGPLSWVSGQASRPGRPAAQAWVLHANPDWSEHHIDDEPDEIVEQLLAAVRSLPMTGPFEVKSARAHRWRYALARDPLESGAFWFGDLRLALAGDWCHGSRVEGAFLSGAAAAGRIMTAAEWPELASKPTDTGESGFGLT
jgi:photolyase PhrII